MNGLDAIKDRILYIAKDKASDIDFVAQKNVEGIIKDAQEKAQNIIDKSKEEANTEISNIEKRYKSLAISQERKIILSKRQEMILQTLEDAKLNLEKMDESEKENLYIEILEKTLSNNEKQEVQFNSKDIDLAKKVQKKVSKPFEISKENGDFLGGFVIYNGNVETNMTFEMTIKHYKDELLAIAAKELFG